MAEEISEWAAELDWGNYIEDDFVRQQLIAIREKVIELGGEEDQELANAPRIKLVVVGDGAVGKTCLLVAYQSGTFPEEYVPTVFENMTHTMEYNGEKILLLLWDTAGQEDYDRLRPLSYPGSDVILLCFSLMNEISYEAISEKWSPEVNVYCPNVPRILVGTKADLRDANLADEHSDTKTKITKERGQELAKEIGASAYCEVSAKTGEGLQALYETAVRTVLESRGK